MADRIVVMNQGVIEQVGTPSEIYRKPATRLRRRLRRHHDVPRRRGRGPDRLRFGSIELACNSVNGFQHGAAVRIGLRPEEVRVRNIDASTPNQIATRVVAARFPRLVLPRPARARGRARRRDPRRLLRQPDARSFRRRGPEAHHRAAAGIAARVREGMSVSVTTAASLPVIAQRVSREAWVARVGRAAAGRLAGALDRAAALGAAVEKLPERATASSSGSRTTSAISRRRACSIRSSTASASRSSPR